jgi:signal transduction histidine kinase/ActR/RegA family two-component response regulator
MDMSSIHHYMPHGHCYLWEPGLVAAHGISDILIGLSYLSISICLYLLIRKIKVPFSTVFIAFGVFIAACGLTHFMEVWNLWYGDYWEAAGIKIVTAGASVATAIWLYPLTPKIVSFAKGAMLSEQRKKDLEVAYAEMENRVKDRTKQIENLYQSAKRANQLKDEFLATVSHELRTPISVILGYSEMISMGEMGPNEYKEAHTAIRRNAETQSRLVNDLLDVSMIISGKMHLNAELVDIKEVVESAIETMSIAAKAKNIRVSVQMTNEETFTYGDNTRLQQIFWNLISNSVKFTPRGGEIHIQVSVSNNRCVIRVSDNGAGINPEFLPFVFDRFRQEESSYSRKYGGMGLGLGIVRHLVELHGGTVKAESDGKDAGSTFTVELPQDTETKLVDDQAEKLSMSDVLKRIKNVRILVVDDENDVRELIATVLKKSNIDVEVAASAPEAIIKASTFKPNLIICDIGMPVVDGYALIKSIREQELHTGTFTPAIALTAYAQVTDRNRALASGFQKHISKPVSGDTLLREISYLVAD